MLKTTTAQDTMTVGSTSLLYRAQQFMFAPFSYHFPGGAEEEVVPTTPTTPTPSIKHMTPSIQQTMCHQQTVDGVSRKKEKNDLCVFASAAFRPKLGYSKLKNEAQERRNRKDCGEDAFFISTSFSTQPSQNDNTERVCAIGIADGVGGYSNMGVDPSIMAWALMEESQLALDNNANISPYNALIEAYEKIRRENLVECGGSTACVLLMSKGKDDAGNHVLKLQSTNLGDSAFMIIRDGKIVYRSVEQTHFWNCPLQMCVPPKHVADVFQDHPREADTLPVPFDLRVGDVVIAATDGLTDNVFDEKIAEIVQTNLDKHSDHSTDITGTIAQSILDFAVQQATSRTSYTPFQKYAQENRYLYKGGKQDDISLVVARIYESE